jgi:hypothetical protein
MRNNKESGSLKQHDFIRTADGAKLIKLSLKLFHIGYETVDDL